MERIVSRRGDSCGLRLGGRIGRGCCSGGVEKMIGIRRELLRVMRDDDAHDREESCDGSCEVVEHTLSESRRMSGEALFFAAQFRHPSAPDFFLTFLPDDEMLQRCWFDERNSANTLSGDGAVSCETRNVVEGEVYGACGVARPDVGHAINDDLA